MLVLAAHPWQATKTAVGETRRVARDTRIWDRDLGPPTGPKKSRRPAIDPTRGGTHWIVGFTMGNNNRFRLILSTIAIALLGTACELSPTTQGDECFIDANYQISCPQDTPDLGIKSN